MEWFYVRNGERIGPVSEAEFLQRVASGEIAADTLVWHEGLAEWTKHGNLAVAPAAAMGACVECGTVYPLSEMVAHQGSHVCAACKPLYFQKLQEGAPLPGAPRYAGFGIRFLAYLIDMIIGFLMGLPFTMGQVTFSNPADGEISNAGAAGMALMYLGSFAIAIAYKTFFVGRFGATPGKMACGLRIIRAGGGKVTYLRAFGRYFAEAISAMVCFIGYIMAGFDDQKRALHDHICDTRVVYK